MNSSPLYFRRFRLAIDGAAEDVEHSRNDGFSDGDLQRAARILDRHPSGQPLRRCQGDSANATGIELRHHFDDDLRFLARPQDGVDGRQTLCEVDIDDASTDGDD